MWLQVTFESSKIAHCCGLCHCANSMEATNFTFYYNVYPNASVFHTGKHVTSYFRSAANLIFQYAVRQITFKAYSELFGNPPKSGPKS